MHFLAMSPNGQGATDSYNGQDFFQIALGVVHAQGKNGIWLEVGAINIFTVVCLVIALFKVQATNKFTMQWNSLTLQAKSQLPKWME